MHVIGKDVESGRKACLCDACGAAYPFSMEVVALERERLQQGQRGRQGMGQIRRF